MNIAFFDLDNTIVEGNSTYQFVKMIEMSRYNLNILNKLNYFLFVIKLKFFVNFLNKPKKVFLLSRLKNIHFQQINKYAQSYVTSHLKYNDLIVELINSEKENSQICIISAGLCEIVSLIAAKLGISNFYCSKMAYSPLGLFSGYLENDLTGKKSIYLQKFIQNFRTDASSKITFTTDNYEDVNCKNIATIRAVILYKHDNLYWQKNGIEHYIYSAKGKK